MSFYYKLFIVFLSGITISIPIILLTKKAAYRLLLVDHPKEDRWHTKPITNLGGVSIYISWLTGLLVIGYVNSESVIFQHYYKLAIYSSLIMLVGLIDDRIVLKPLTKLMLQSLVVGIAVYDGFQVGFFDSMVWNYIFSFFWIIFLINSINFLDNMDGLAAGVVLIIGVGLFILSLTSDDTNHRVLLSWILLLGVLIGYLKFNSYPASIFMGDSGSHFLGFMLATHTMPTNINNDWLNLAQGQFFDPLILIFILLTMVSFPLFDTLFVIVSRIRNKIPPWQGGVDHISHRLVKSGSSEKNAVSIIYLVCIISSYISYVLISEPGSYGVVIFLLALFYSILCWRISIVNVYNNA